MKRLSGLDAMCLYGETPGVHTHTIKMAVSDGPGLGGRVQFLRSTVHAVLLGLPPLRYGLVEIPLRLHHPMWREGVPIAASYHIRRVSVAPPGGRRDLDDVISVVAASPLDRRYPLWQMYIAEGMTGRHFDE